MLAEGFINKSCRRYSICAVRRSDKAVAFTCSMLSFAKGVVVVLWASYSINAYMCCWHQHQQSSKQERMALLQVMVEKTAVHRMHMLAYPCWPAPVIVTTACVHCPAKMPTLLELASSMKCNVFTSVCHLNNRIAGVWSCLTSYSPCTAGRTALCTGKIMVVMSQYLWKVIIKVLFCKSVHYFCHLWRLSGGHWQENITRWGLAEVGLVFVWQYTRKATLKKK